MPGEQDGLDLARIIARRWPALPVLLATGYSEAHAGFSGGLPAHHEALSARCVLNQIIHQVTSEYRAERTNVIALPRR